MIAHQAAGERPCGWCAAAETAARLSAEAVTFRPPAGSLEPVSEVQGRVNADLLEREVAAYERDRGAGGRYHDELARRRRKRGAA
jgi:hypothetical protein